MIFYKSEASTKIKVIIIIYYIMLKMVTRTLCLQLRVAVFLKPRLLNILQETIVIQHNIFHLTY